jgi:hypothetical protein
MDVGKPQRVYRVEPLREPVPSRPEPAEPPAPKPVEPEKVPAK